MRLWNIGAEGQFLLGAWGASAVVLGPLLPPGTPGFILIPAMMLAGAAAGAIWGFIPGFLRARLGVNEIITTLMLNYVALFWVQFWVFGPWSEGGFQQTAPFPPEAWLPRLTDFASAVPAFAGLTVHLGLVFGLIAAGIVWIVLERSRWGYEIRLAGDSPARRALRRDRHRPECHRRVRGLRRARRPRRHERGLRGRSTGCRIGSRRATASPRSSSPTSPGSTRSGSSSRPILFGALILAGREIQPSGVPAMIQGDHPVLRSSSPRSSSATGSGSNAPVAAA